VPLSPESITRGEPSSLSARGPRQHTATTWCVGPAGVEEQGIDTSGFPRNLGRPVPSTMHVRPETGSATPGLSVTRSGPAGAKHRRTSWYRQAKHNEARRDGGRESERSIVPWKSGNPPAGTRWREGGAGLRNCWEETGPVHRNRTPCQRNNNRQRSGRSKTRNGDSPRSTTTSIFSGWRRRSTGRAKRGSGRGRTDGRRLALQPLRRMKNEE